jgi:hypothetical protein
MTVETIKTTQMSQDEKNLFKKYLSPKYSELLMVNLGNIGNIVGARNLPKEANNIRPAQMEVIPSVIEEKQKLLKTSLLPLVVEAWKSGNGMIWIQDGQHRFVASVNSQRPVVLAIKRIGMPAFQGTWSNVIYANVTPAKDRIKKF